MKIDEQRSSNHISPERERTRSSDAVFAQYLERETSGPQGSGGHVRLEVELPDFAESKPSLEQHRLPDWMNQYLSPLQDLSGSQAAIEETRRHVAEQDRETLSDAPANQELKQQSTLRARFRAELHELAYLREQTLDATLSNVGLSRDSLSLLHNDISLSSRVHDTFHEMLTADTRARELMQKLGVKPRRTD